MEYPLPIRHAVQKEIVGMHCRVHVLGRVDGVEENLFYIMDVLPALIGSDQHRCGVPQAYYPHY